MSKNRWSQFSLRSFILVTIVLGTALGFYLSRPQLGLVELTSDNFDALALSSKRPVLVAFRANWCGPCRKMDPLLRELATEQSRAMIGTVDIDDQPKLAARFSVNAVPTLLVIQDGKVVDTQRGAIEKDRLTDLIAP